MSVNAEQVTISVLAQELRAMAGQGESLDKALDRIFSDYNIDADGRRYLRPEILCRVTGGYPEEDPIDKEHLLEDLAERISILNNFQDRESAYPFLDSIDQACRYRRISLPERLKIKRFFSAQKGKVGGHRKAFSEKRLEAMARQVNLF